MINEINISNFQSHKATTLELDPGVNIIVGPSDSGKTAIIRALWWLIWNRPQGDAMRSNWGGDTYVGITIRDKWITRKKVDGRNEYVFSTGQFHQGKYTPQPGGSHIYGAIKSDVPEEVQKALNINEINLQRQMDRPFLLDDSSGAVAQHFNKVAHLDVIDTGLQNIQKWLRNIEQNIITEEARLVCLQITLTEYEHLDELEKLIESLEKKEQKKRELYKNIRALIIIIESMKQVRQSIKRHDATLEIGDLVNQTLSLFASCNERVLRYTTLSKLIIQLITTKNSLSEEEGKLKRLQVKFKKEFPNICPLCGQEVSK